VAVSTSCAERILCIDGMRSEYAGPVAEWDADPVLLRTLLAVRARRSLTRAAEDLFVSQPAVSRRMKRLERSLGVPLFERLGNALHLTDAGEAVAAEAAALLGSADRFAEVVRARRSGEGARIRVGASTTPGLYLLPGLLARLRARRPRISVEFSIESSREIEERLVRNDLDLALVGAHLTHHALALTRVATDRIVFYAAPHHPLARERRLGARDLAEHPCVARQAGSATRRVVDAWRRRSRVRFSNGVEVACPEAAKVLVRAGLGYAYVSVHALDGAGGRGLAALEVEGTPLTRPIFLVRHADKRLSDAMETFVAECASLA
jgi:DNA-binding transcriptional LysR family regulator